MMQKLRSISLTAGVLSILLIPAAFVAASMPASADITSGNINSSLCAGSNINITDLSGTATCPSTSTSNFQKLLEKIINIFTVVVGVIAVVMIIVGGLRYITSGGESNKVGGAKTTIIYALVGLVVVALAQLIVHFVLSQSSGLTG